MMDSDGAAALVLVSGEKVLQLGLQVIAKIKGYADAAQVLQKNIIGIWLNFDETYCKLVLKQDCVCRHPNYSQRPQPLQYQKLFQMLVWKLLRLITMKLMKPFL